MTGPAIRAVLWDVGGPIDTEVAAERLIDAEILRLVRNAGIDATEQDLARANDWAIAAFAPHTYISMIWRLCGGDPATVAKVQPLAMPGRPFELRPGIAELLNSLHARDLRLGLAANQPARILEMLDQHGIGHLFAHREVSGHHGYHKPDVRLFLRACEDLGVEPRACIMVGDRIDNDIVPARLLGMRTVLFRSGRHAGQQPRSAAEVPDAVVTDVPALAAAIDNLVAGR